VLYELPDRGTAAITVDRDVVNDRLRPVMEDEDLRRYIL
jgi:ATP-dependent protease HslVU (ClpYQ) ATPase subunit